MMVLIVFCMCSILVWKFVCGWVSVLLVINGVNILFMVGMFRL